MSDSAPGSSQSNSPKEIDVLFEGNVRLRDHPGQAKIVTVEAPSKDAAIQKLIAQGFMVIDVQEHGKRKAGLKDIFSMQRTPSGKGSSQYTSLFSGRVTMREVIFFAVQLATLLKAGIPLLRALEIIEKGIANVYFRQIIDRMRTKISEGGTFSNALRANRRVFPWIWVNLVEVGETTGKLPDCLEEIAHYQEAEMTIKRKVGTAFFYPGILATAVLAAMTFLLVVVIPKFTAIFTAQHLTLPAITQFVIGISNVLREHFVYVAGVVVAMVIAFIYTSKVPTIKIVYDRVALKAPLFGAILVQVAVVRFCRSLGTLLRSGVQILQALEIAGRLVENQFIEKGLKRVGEAVRSGQGLGIQLEARKIFPVFMTQLITVGEESGQLDRFLDLLSNYYEEQVDTFLSRLATLLEPLMLLIMGGIIGTIVIAMFLPIIQLSSGGAVM